MRRLNSLALSSASFFALGLALVPSAARAQPAQPATPTQSQDCDTLPEGDRAACRAGQTQAPPPASTATSAAADTIVVTGSRIARPNYDTDAPAVIISSEQIENRGFETLGQAINEQPAFGVPGASPVGAAQGGSFGSGQSFVNFLGLGDQRTLVLVNGHRFVSSNTASIFGPSNAGLQVDLNEINTRLVDRVETIAIGGAPIYGSDAIAMPNTESPRQATPPTTASAGSGA
jgi:outer membrane cobalamin receptor